MFKSLQHTTLLEQPMITLCVSLSVVVSSPAHLLTMIFSNSTDLILDRHHNIIIIYDRSVRASLLEARNR